MITKYKNLGTALSEQEMKEIKGGIKPPHFHIYDCFDGFSHFNYCSDVDPGPTCGVTCTVGDLCTVKTWTGNNCW
jgi:hypothetical protein